MVEQRHNFFWSSQNGRVGHFLGKTQTMDFGMKGFLGLLQEPFFGFETFLGIERDTKLVGGVYAFYFWSLSRIPLSKVEEVIIRYNSLVNTIWRSKQLNHQTPTQKYRTKKTTVGICDFMNSRKTSTCELGIPKPPINHYHLANQYGNGKSLTKFKTHTHTQNIYKWSIFHYHFDMLLKCNSKGASVIVNLFETARIVT